PTAPPPRFTLSLHDALPIWGMSHDFNNVLQAILGYAQLVKQNPRDAEFVNRSLSIVESAALDGSEMVRRIQTFARLRPEEQFVADRKSTRLNSSHVSISYAV